MANDDTAKKADDAAQVAVDDAIDPEVEAIAKDPKAVKTLLDAKRAANAEAKKLRLEREEAAKAEKAKEDAALAEQGKYKELLEQEKGVTAAIKSASAKRLVDLYLKLEAQSSGAVDEDAVIALVARDGIKVSDDFDISGVKEAVEALKKAKPHLFGKTDTPVPPPGTRPPAPRAGFITKIDGKTSTASEDARAGFSGAKK